MNTCSLVLRRALGAARTAAPAPAVHGAMLRVLDNVRSGSSNGYGGIGAG